MNAGDWGALKNPLLVLIGIVALGMGLIYYLDESLDTAKRELVQQQSQQLDARTRLQKSGEEKNIIVRYLSDYQGAAQTRPRADAWGYSRFPGQHGRSQGEH